MSHFDATNPDDPEPDDEAIMAELAAERLTFQTRLDAAEPELRKLGVYVDQTVPHQVHTPFGPKIGMVIMSTIGDVAFTQRVQDPDAYAMDNQFAGIESGAHTDEFLDERARIAAQIEEARAKRLAGE